jgi:hypothetical protein
VIARIPCSKNLNVLFIWKNLRPVSGGTTTQCAQADKMSA